MGHARWLIGKRKDVELNQRQRTLGLVNKGWGNMCICIVQVDRLGEVEGPGAKRVDTLPTVLRRRSQKFLDQSPTSTLMGPNVGTTRHGHRTLTRVRLEDHTQDYGTRRPRLPPPTPNSPQTTPGQGKGHVERRSHESGVCLDLRSFELGVLSLGPNTSG